MVYYSTAALVVVNLAHSLSLSHTRTGSLNKQESILVLAVCGGVLLLFAFSLLTLVCLCYCCRRQKRDTYNVNKEEDGEFKRQPSIRKDNSGVLTQSPSNNYFGNMFEFQPSSLEGSSIYPPTNIPLTPYSQGSIISESIQHSPMPPTPSPIPPVSGTIGSTSLFSTEDQSSITTNLPNFPRSNLKVRESVSVCECVCVCSPGLITNVLCQVEFCF